MKNLKIILLVALTTCLTFSCGSDDSESESEIFAEGGPFALSELTGNWEATSALFWASSVLNVDIVADGGSLSLTVQSNRRCTFTVNPVDRDAYTASGEMFWGSSEGFDAIVIVWDDDPDNRSSFESPELTGTTFLLGCISDCGEYDFNNNGTSETADMVFNFIRN